MNYARFMIGASGVAIGANVVLAVTPAIPWSTAAAVFVAATATLALGGWIRARLLERRLSNVQADLARSQAAMTDLAEHLYATGQAAWWPPANPSPRLGGPA